MRNATNIAFVPSKPCRNCSRIIYLGNHIAYEDPNFNDVHKCPNWKPREHTELQNQLKEMKADIVRSLEELTREVNDLRRAIRNG